VRARFRNREVLTNPPPSSGGILIAYALELLERHDPIGLEDLVEAMRAAQDARTEQFLESLYDDRLAARFLDQARRAGADRLGSTTHITAVDGDGRCASVTCSNGTGSGLVVPGTGVHVNNMLGEEDLNPHGFHRQPAGRRMPSMMSPTVVLADGGLEAGLGSGGSNRIRSAILQTIVRLVGDRLDVETAVVAPRVHFEGGSVQAEPGIDEGALERLAGRGYEVVRWPDRNVFFGGVHAVARDPRTGAMSGAGDPRRGGAVAAA
jgi:gamma-glutamyltranspeptidase/glutathione hydrolase